MNAEGWWFLAVEGFCRLTDERTFVNVELLLQLKMFSFVFGYHGDLRINLWRLIWAKLTETRSKIYRCDSDKAAIVAHDIKLQNVKQKSYNITKRMVIYLNVKIFKC